MCHISKIIFPYVCWFTANSTEQLYVWSFLIPKGHCSSSFLQMWASLCFPGAGAIRAPLTATLLWEKRGHCSHFHNQICFPSFGLLGQNEIALIHKGDSALLPSLGNLAVSRRRQLDSPNFLKAVHSLQTQGLKKKRSYYGSTVACTDLQNLAVPPLIRLRIKYLPLVL